MNYCSYSDVGVLLQRTFDATSDPTDAQVTEIISQVTGEIDVYFFNVGIASQPTDANILKMIKKYCSMGAAGLVGTVYFGNIQGQGNTQSAFYYQEYQRFLNEMIIKNPGLFQQTGTGIRVSSPALDGSLTASEIDDFENKVTSEV